MSNLSYDTIFESFNNLRVLIIGDVMIDSYLWGKVDRISPEAPVPVVQVKQKEKRLGGAANVAKNISAMGATPVLCTVIGNDEEGNNIISLSHSHNFPTDGIVKSNSRQTTVKHRIISGSQHLLRIDTEDDELLKEEENRNLLTAIEKLIPTADVVIFEDYDKGVISENLIGQVVSLAKKHNTPTVVDPKKRNFLAYKNVDLFKPNLKELKEGLNIECNPADIDSIESGVQKLKTHLQQKIAFITLSEHGAYISSDKDKIHTPAHLRNIADVSGAGDTVISVTALCLASGMNENQILQIANLAGGLVCEHVGVVSIDKQQLLDEVKKQLN